VPRPARRNFEDVSTNSLGFAGFSVGGPRRGPEGSGSGDDDDDDDDDDDVSWGSLGRFVESTLT
jgi:hypothetical protein